MNPLLLAFLAQVLAGIAPNLIPSTIDALIAFLDPIMATKGFVMRGLWALAKAALKTSSFQSDVLKVMNEIKSHPQVVAAAKSA